MEQTPLEKLAAMIEGQDPQIKKIAAFATKHGILYEDVQALLRAATVKAQDELADLSKKNK